MIIIFKSLVIPAFELSWGWYLLIAFSIENWARFIDLCVC